MCERLDQETQDAKLREETNRKVVHSEDLFHGEREIQIEHEGEFYRLRITRRNKLILQK